MSGKLKEVRDRIKSVKSTQQITSAMKMVSAAKLRKAQDAITKIRPYSDRLNLMMKNILTNLEGEASTKFGLSRDLNKVLIVIITSNRGLCGAFNSNIIKEAIQLVDNVYAKQRKNNNLSLLFIGKRGYDYFRKRYKDCHLINDYVELVKELSFENVAEVSQLVLDMFESGEVDKVHVSYGRFKNAGVQYSECVNFLPVEKIEVKEAEKLQFLADYIFEPDKENLLEYLVPSILQTTFHRYILDTHASEHGARMTAMDKATENADEILKELKLNYNKARQEAITKELSEIVGGAASLEG